MRQSRHERMSACQPRSPPNEPACTVVGDPNVRPPSADRDIRIDATPSSLDGQITVTV
jgi:hypothetical protein